MSNPDLVKTINSVLPIDIGDDKRRWEISGVVAGAILRSKWHPAGDIPNPEWPDVLVDGEDNPVEGWPEAVGNLVEKWGVWVSNNNGEVGDFAADVRRIADAFPPPARTVSTVEELEALPQGSVVRSSGGEVFEAASIGWENLSDPDDSTWHPRDLIDNGPLTVLHEGGA